MFPDFPLVQIPLTPKFQDITEVESVAQAVAPAPAPAAPAAPVLPTIDLSPEMLIVVGIVLAGLLFLYYVILLHRALHQSLKQGQYIKDIYASMYVSDQIKEYMIVFSDLTEAQSEQDQINARTQIFNFLNRISRQICESKDESLSIKLGEAFFSKIEGRFVKMAPIPDGVYYFRTVAEILIANNGRLAGQALARVVRKEYKSGVASRERLVAEPMPKKKMLFGKNRKESSKKA
ncbi:MAG: hypothetical protein ACRCY4_04810 [Brevinema sp.]